MCVSQKMEPRWSAKIFDFVEFSYTKFVDSPAHLYKTSGLPKYRQNDVFCCLVGVFAEPV